MSIRALERIAQNPEVREAAKKVVEEVVTRVGAYVSHTISTPSTPSDGTFTPAPSSDSSTPSTPAPSSEPASTTSSTSTRTYSSRDESESSSTTTIVEYGETRSWEQLSPNNPFKMAARMFGYVFGSKPTAPKPSEVATSSPKITELPDDDETPTDQVGVVETFSERTFEAYEELVSVTHPEAVDYLETNQWAFEMTVPKHLGDCMNHIDRAYNRLYESDPMHPELSQFSYDQFPELFELALDLEGTLIDQGKIPAYHALNPTLSAVFELATRMNKPDAENYKMLRDPSALKSRDETLAEIDEGFAHGKVDNDMGKDLISFSYGLFSNPRKFESALYGLRKWSATSPTSVINRFMKANLKARGLNEDQIGKVLDSKQFKDLMKAADSLPNSELLVMGIPKEKAHLHGYNANRYGFRREESIQLTVENPSEENLRADGGLQGRLVCSKETLQEESGIEMHFLGLEQEKVKAHVKKHASPSRTPAKKTSVYQRIVGDGLHTTTIEMRSQKTQAKIANTLIPAVLELVNEFAEQNEKERTDG